MLTVARIHPPALLAVLAAMTLSLAAAQAGADAAAPAAPPATPGAIAWPTLQSPEGTRSAIVAPDVVLNGKRSHIVRLQMKASVDDARAFYKQQFNGRFVENRWKDTWLIASQQGEFFHTLQLSAAPGGKAQALAVSTAMAGPRARSTVMADTERMLPPDSAVALSNESSDGPLRSVLMTGVNRHSVDANVDHTVEQLKARGYRVVRQDSHAVNGRPAQSVWLDGEAGSAIVSVVDVGEQRAVSIQRSKEINPTATAAAGGGRP
jgi:hypothetical protein